MIGYIVGTLSKMEKIRIAERCRDAKQSILDKGLIIESGNAKYGYQYKDGRRVVDPITGPIVQRIFTEVASGVTLCQLAIKLTQEGIPAPRVKWSQPMLGKVIRDPSYYGTPMRWHQTKATDKRSTTNGRLLRVPSTPKHIGEGTPALVTREVWDKAQVMVAENKKRGGGVKLELWLRGHVFCAECGHSMTPHPLHNGKYEYRCKYAAANQSDCMKVGFPLDDVEAVVRTELRSCFDVPSMVRQLVAENLPATVDWQERVVAHEKDVSLLKKKLSKVVARLGDSDDAVINDALESQMTSLSEQIHREESTLNEARRMAAASKSKAAILADVDELLAAKGHKDVLTRLGVKVYLLALEPGDSRKLVPWFRNWPLKVPEVGHVVAINDSIPPGIPMSPDRKGRQRKVLLRLFDFLKSKTPSTSHSTTQEIPAVFLSTSEEKCSQREQE